MISAICTLFENDYHLGLGAWANSLYAHGYRGTIYAGYRGNLPPWLTGAKPADGFTEFTPAEGLTLRFIPLATKLHLTNFKPDFMLEVWRNHCPQAEALFYFDPDITILCRWTFFEEWVEAGVAVCQDVNGWMPDNHPIRHGWRKLLQPADLEFRTRFETYFNGGFVGLRTEDRVFLNDWRRVQTLMQNCGVDFSVIGFGDRTYPFTCRDQDALNITCMATGRKISPLGQDGMDFQHGGGGYVMSHAAGGTKPWRKRMLVNMIAKGSPPSRADKCFYSYTQHPIRVFPAAATFWRKLDLLLASAIGRYIR
ncbi:MAG: hypothetical protein P4N60_05525 [Verrucomicrobiae bacterium]|nr:hypothetical protein [Verrucomicrobiae bacterium]